MTVIGKKLKSAYEKVDDDKKYPLEDAIELAKKAKFAGFDETFDMAVRLGVDPGKADQMVRGSVVLPGGTGKKRRIVVFAKGEKELEAREAGVDYAGGDDLIEKIKGGWLEFDVAVATPDMMSSVSKLGKVLGPRGLMPNPKSGTVTFDVAKAVEEINAGKVEFRVDKSGVVHAPLGKISFDLKALLGNAKAFLEAVVRLKPSALKGAYIKSISISTTMGPGIKIDEANATAFSG
ncbi:MAG: 50S ribosomal protein L1 [bacterium]|nr:MAG: 50S ribosomal protein L1 [bacterium]